MAQFSQQRDAQIINVVYGICMYIYSNEYDSLSLDLWTSKHEISSSTLKYI